MDALKLVFLAKTCFKVADGSVKNLEAIIFHINPYYYVLLYFITDFVLPICH